MSQLSDWNELSHTTPVPPLSWPWPLSILSSRFAVGSFTFLSLILPISSVQLLSHVRLFTTQWTAPCQASLSIINSQSLLKLMSIKLVMPSNHLILCHPLLLLHSIIPSIRVFSNESALPTSWPKYWNFSFSISHSNAYLRLISFRTDLTSLQSNGLSLSLFIF